MTRALRIAQRNAIVYRRVWRGSLFFGFLQPTLFLVAMGVGLGAFVDQGGAALPGGVSFLHFLAPGLLAGACMQTASFESTFPITGRMTWHRNYEAIAATPVRVSDIVLGELAWMSVRLTLIAVTFTLVITAFGAPRSPLALLAVPAAVLTGVAFSAPLIAHAGAVKTGAGFNVVFRFVITPLFLFSGVFFPVSRLPEWLQAVAWCTPLFHGVELVRGLTLGTLQSPAWQIHVFYLCAMTVLGVLVAVRTFTRRLHT